MCVENADGEGPAVVAVPSIAPGGSLDLRDVARAVAAMPEQRSPHIVGYGATKAGDQVLIAIDTHYEQRVAEAFADALRERGATVDILRVDAGPDRVFEALDEIRVTIR